MNQINALRQLGYTVTFSHGPTPEKVRQHQRETGWAWEGDELPDDFPEHMILRDDSHEPTVHYIEGPVGFEHSDGTPIAPLISGYVREDDDDTGESIVASHAEILAELTQRAQETPEETSERHERERASEQDVG